MPYRFKETGYVSTRQDVIRPHYPDIETTNNAIE